MAMIGNIIAMADSGNPATVNYGMFCAAFSLVSLFYLFPATINSDWSLHPILMIILDVLNAIFFLSEGIALAARLECHSCNNRHYLLHNGITNGAKHRLSQRCREAQAAVAFLWFCWFGYTVSLVFSIITASKFRGVNLRSRGRRASGRPGMAQV